ncbi:unnamed protein product [Prorocentrum cordatum]|uniref:Uncharacterized protein n=1 Tax=Prorocentrum cordatum TaxID=2364126 RepID=A0ABN9U3B2_9DINO|nr:unnamed protein product [Polarella glacialis]
MHRTGSLLAAALLLAGAQAVQRSADGLGAPAGPAAWAAAGAEGRREGSPYPAWLTGLEAAGHGVRCSMEEECIVGHGRGICYVMVDADRETVPLISTDSGYEVTFSGSVRFGLELRFKEYRDAAQNLTSDHNITVEGHSDSSHWNLCWKPGMVSEWQSGARRNTGVEDYCYYVNGLCFLWASPCTGGCSTLGALTGPLSNPLYATFCPAGLRFATEAEWTAAEPTLYANKEDFHAKCAAEVLDPDFNHCDLQNTFKRVPNGGYEEQVLVCGDAQTPAPPAPTPAPAPAPAPAPSPPAPSTPGTGGGVSATGDPHLQNVHGQRFDLMKPGKHVLINIPKGELEHQLLVVQADARRLGGCKDMYFQELNITGSWAEAKQAGGYRHTVKHRAAGTPQWAAFGTLELKVVHGHTKGGLEYLNFYVKHLGRVGFAVGGLLGDDDHTAAATPSGSCARRGLAL